ncbi:MAG: hypothetical protein SOY63_04360 [Alloprevotella sp.]|nr:hypothetical protein [Alloprevotella sp.]
MTKYIKKHTINLSVTRPSVKQSPKWRLKRSFLGIEERKISSVFSEIRRGKTVIRPISGSTTKRERPRRPLSSLCRSKITLHGETNKDKTGRSGDGYRPIIKETENRPFNSPSLVGNPINNYYI